METIQMGKQVITFQKTLFESSFNAMCAVQDQTEKIIGNFLDQMNWVPAEGKKTIQEAIDFYKEARGNFKKAVDEGFDKLEKMVAKG